jgi:endonuclease YncB( thermonuclease family)
VIGVSKLALALVAVVGGVGTAAAVALTPAPSTDSATVTRVIDGDTIDVDIDGRTERIRLLNVDTPETKDPNQPVQCLGPEATAYLAGVLPTGTRIRLEYDRERTDRYDRTLAAVFSADGTLVNAEIARQGLASVVVIDGNDRFYPRIAAARDEAVAARRGLYSQEIACTLPGQVNTVTAAANGLAASDAAASSADLDSAAAAAAKVVALATALDNAFAIEHLDPVWSAIGADERRRLAALVTATRETAQRNEAETRSAAAAARSRETAEVAERDRQARDQAARKQRDRQVREQAAAREERERQTRQNRDSTPDSAPQAAPKPRSDNPYPGYTGPRCYAPGGVTWKPC